MQDICKLVCFGHLPVFVVLLQAVSEKSMEVSSFITYFFSSRLQYNTSFHKHSISAKRTVFSLQLILFLALIKLCGKGMRSYKWEDIYDVFLTIHSKWIGEFVAFVFTRRIKTDKIVENLCIDY